jgi:hypothetical protein
MESWHMQGILRCCRGLRLPRDTADFQPAGRTEDAAGVSRRSPSARIAVRQTQPFHAWPPLTPRGGPSR